MELGGHQGGVRKANSLDSEYKSPLRDNGDCQHDDQSLERLEETWHHITNMKMNLSNKVGFVFS